MVGLPSPPRSGAGTNQDAPAQSPVPASLFPRHYPCQQRLIAPVEANVLGRFSMAGFEVITYGRFWVIAEVQIDPKQKLIEIGELWKYGAEKREAELKKCQLLCNPCHREKTCEDNGWLYSVGVHGLPSSHRYCHCEICLDAWKEYQHKRKRILGKMPAVPKPREVIIIHGTRAGYLKEVKLKIPTCEDCRKANAEYTRQLKTRLASVV